MNLGDNNNSLELTTFGNPVPAFPSRHLTFYRGENIDAVSLRPSLYETSRNAATLLRKKGALTRGCVPRARRKPRNSSEKEIGGPPHL